MDRTSDSGDNTVSSGSAGEQLEIQFESRKNRAERLLAELRAMGLKVATTCQLTRNNSTMVSLSRGKLRVHEAFATAPAATKQAIVDFVSSRNRSARIAARRIILAHDVPVGTRKVRRRRRQSIDARLEEKLALAHAELNERHFASSLTAMRPVLSAKMRTRLGHYSPPPTGKGTGSGSDGTAPRAGLAERDKVGAEIAISLRHAKRDSWKEVLDTLLHEMVHQWQFESGLPLDHGREFRRKAREVGATPSARRPLAISFLR